tara:strand:- start:154 stop:612 length:459 start_codon:yes stop_codon:yes gene_type:complete
MAKVTHRWDDVRAGDIISFRYRGAVTNQMQLHTILVVNPRLTVRKKDGKTQKYLSGIKIETSNAIDLRITPRIIQKLEEVGKFTMFDKENEIYKLVIDDKFLINDIKGAKKKVYEVLSRELNIRGQWRTYDYFKAKKSAVFLEPITVRHKDY